MNSYNKQREMGPEMIPELNKNIDSVHEEFLRNDDHEKKTEAFRYLTGYIRQYLSLVPHNQKFRFNETKRVLSQSAMNIADFDPREASIAFEQLALYARNLIDQPWRTDFHIVKLTSGFFVHNIEAHLHDAHTILIAMGYVNVDDKTLKLVPNYNVKVLKEVSRDCYVASQECLIISQIWQRVSEIEPDYPLTTGEIFEFRQKYMGNTDTICSTLLSDIRKRQHEHYLLEQERTRTTQFNHRSSNNHPSRPLIVPVEKLIDYDGTDIDATDAPPSRYQNSFSNHHLQETDLAERVLHHTRKQYGDDEQNHIYDPVYNDNVGYNHQQQPNEIGHHGLTPFAPSINSVYPTSYGRNSTSHEATKLEKDVNNIISTARESSSSPMIPKTVANFRSSTNMRNDTPTNSSSSGSSKGYNNSRTSSTNFGYGRGSTVSAAHGAISFTKVEENECRRERVAEESRYPSSNQIIPKNNSALTTQLTRSRKPITAISSYSSGGSGGGEQFQPISNKRDIQHSSSFYNHDHDQINERYVEDEVDSVSSNYRRLGLNANSPPHAAGEQALQDAMAYRSEVNSMKKKPQDEMIMDYANNSENNRSPIYSSDSPISKSGSSTEASWETAERRKNSSGSIGRNLAHKVGTIYHPKLDDSQVQPRLYSVRHQAEQQQVASREFCRPVDRPSDIHLKSSNDTSRLHNSKNERVRASRNSSSSVHHHLQQQQQHGIHSKYCPQHNSTELEYNNRSSNNSKAQASTEYQQNYIGRASGSNSNYHELHSSSTSPSPKSPLSPISRFAQKHEGQQLDSLETVYYAQLLRQKRTDECFESDMHSGCHQQKINSDSDDDGRTDTLKPNKYYPDHGFGVPTKTTTSSTNTIETANKKFGHLKMESKSCQYEDINVVEQQQNYNNNLKGSRDEKSIPEKDIGKGSNNKNNVPKKNREAVENEIESVISPTNKPTKVIEPWQCLSCTFINETSERICEVCCKTKDFILDQPDKLTSPTENSTSSGSGDGTHLNNEPSSSSSSVNQKLSDTTPSSSSSTNNNSRTIPITVEKEEANVNNNENITTENQIACPHCTYINNKCSLTCEICGGRLREIKDQSTNWLM